MICGTAPILIPTPSPTIQHNRCATYAVVWGGGMAVTAAAGTALQHTHNADTPDDSGGQEPSIASQARF